jgi:hypothetical protein
MRKIPSTFICYSAVDRDFVHNLANDLRRRPVSVWFDDRLRPGQFRQRQLEIAIDAADTVTLVVGAPETGLDAEAAWQLDYALRQAKAVFPVVRAGTVLPPALEGLHPVDMTQDYWVGLFALVEELYTYLDEE